MKLVIADDHALFRESLKALLEARGYTVLAEAKNGREAVALAHRHKPDVLLMDLAMPEVDGLSATRLIAADIPEVKVVILTASDDDQSLFEAVKSGAQGYLLKNLDAGDFFEQLDRVARGEPALTPALARKLMREFAKPAPSRTEDPDALTERELDVLRCLVDGVTSNRKLADRLGVSENTVKFHVRNILDKLHLHNRAQVVAFALRHRIVPSEEG
ncbi:MAG: response regulator transcription factor [Thermoanaerobaculia bacterium]|jgi:DNA-binding NarL/FixJ family response regulator|nr:MAG: response regulator transcription factor [Thermoanaerobaculia bacterium]MBZ0100664.1 response regulator transcription factor [Thermoanaerobaculia bacterium]